MPPYHQDGLIRDLFLPSALNAKRQTLPLTLTVPFAQSLQSGAGTTPSPSHFLPSHRECFVLFCYQLLSCVT